VPSRPAVVLFAIGIALGLAPSAPAQTARPRPRLNYAFPPSGRAGGSLDVTVGGEALDAADGLWFSNPGLTAVPVAGKPRTFRVGISPGTSPGPHDIRALTPDGLSNPRTFVVGTLPESVEVEPNDKRDAANLIGINAVISGTISATDVDCFGFDGRKGERLFVYLAAEAIESPLDATVRLLDSRGLEVAECRDTFGADPFLDVNLPEDGRYFLKVHDVTYAGSPEHVYRLTLRDGPHLDAARPSIATAGQTAELTLLGRHVDGSPMPLKIDGRPIESKHWSGVPTFLPAQELPINALGTLALLRAFPIRPTDDGNLLNPILIAEADAPIVVEREPNGPESPQVVTPPCSVGGSFSRRGDLDTYRFAAKKDEVWRIEAVAEGIGSPADPAFILQRVPNSGDPQDLTTADDTLDPGLAPRFNLASTDASLRWVSPADGFYQVVLSDVAGSSLGEPRRVYRLAIRRERPDFRLFLVPPAINVPDAVTVRKGGRAAAIVLALRLDRFAGPIQVHAEGLPEGLHCDPVAIPSGAISTPIVFEADANVKSSTGVIRLIGTSGELRHEAIPGTIVRPPVKIQNVAANVAPSRAARGFAVAIRDGSPFLLTARARRSVVARGQTLDLEVSVKAADGVPGPITLTGWEPPPGILPVPATLPKGTTSTTLSWPVGTTAAPGPYSLVLKGSAVYQPDPKGKATFNVEVPSNPVLFQVRPAPARISVESSTLKLKAGGKAEVAVKVERLEGFAGPLVLTLDSPAAAKVSAEPVTIPPDKTSATIMLRTLAESPPGPVVATVRAEAVVSGEAIELSKALDVTIEKP
jgi:Bacterial pre-peptidase C-terminal domain